MRFEVDQLKAFYASPLGQMAHEQMAQRIGALWPDAKGMDVLGLGYADRLLEPYRTGARRVISAAPETQGAEGWPEDAPNCAVRVEEERLPFQDAMFDRVIVCHGLEEAGNPHRFLREIWRIAAPEARILIIVANRRGLWSLMESTPMGQGRPYSKSQLNRLMEAAMFQPTASARAVFAPPVRWSVITSAGEAWEKLGRWAWPGFSGVLMIEAVKRVYAEPGPSSGLKAQVNPAAQAEKAQSPIDRNPN